MAKRAEPTCDTTILPGGEGIAVDILATKTQLPKTRLKDAMNKGAVWLHRGNNRIRLRRATMMLRPQDRIILYYDAEMLARHTDPPVLVHDARLYSIWNKPAGMLTQGTDYGDHCSLLRQVELAFRMQRESYPVHRLDREASGLIMVAHTRQAAAKLSDLFQKHQIEKTYRVTVRGLVGIVGSEGVINRPLDGKPAISHYRVESVDPAGTVSRLLVQIQTGRLHQIRRHCADIGHPVMGDPKYGTGNKNTQGLQLCAYSLAFRCPFSGQQVVFTLQE